MIEQEEGLSPLDLIFQRFLLLSRLAEEDGEEWKTLCQDAWFQIVSQKRPSEEEPTPERENLLFAARGCPGVLSIFLDRRGIRRRGGFPRRYEGFPEKRESGFGLEDLG